MKKINAYLLKDLSFLIFNHCSLCIYNQKIIKIKLIFLKQTLLVTALYY